MNEQSILNLDGYLLSLRRLSGNQCDFWVDIFDIESGVENDFKKYLLNRDVTLLESSVVGYKEIDKALEKHLLSKLNVSDESVRKLFLWDVVEYIQMAFRLIEPEIDPISEGKAILVNAESVFHGQHIYVVVPVLNKAIAVGFATRT